MEVLLEMVQELDHLISLGRSYSFLKQVGDFEFLDKFGRSLRLIRHMLLD